MKKFLLYLSIAPIFMLLVVATLNMFYGFDGLCIFGGCPYTYGFKAFFQTIYVYAMLLSTFLPIFPISILYIIYYLISKSSKSKKKVKNIDNLKN